MVRKLEDQQREHRYLIYGDGICPGRKQDTALKTHATGRWACRLCPRRPVLSSHYLYPQQVANMT